MARTKETTFSLDKMLGELAAGIKNPKPNNLQYKPHPKQVLFHSSVAQGRQYIGGNRSGKTTGGINEDIWWLTGRHPYLKLPPAPIIGRITTVDFKTGANKIILPQLSQWLVPSDLINGSWEDSWNGSSHTLKLANDSELEIKSYDQELEKFAGVPRHFIHFDEEPPKDIFDECKARLVDYNGRWWMTMTPVEGMTWTMEEIYEDKTGLIQVIEVNTRDNPYISEEGIQTLAGGYDEDEQAIRLGGQYIAISGLVFKIFDASRHVIPPGIPDPKDYTFYMSLDAGYNNPTAIYWHGVNNNTGQVVTFAEHYRSEWTVQQHAEFIKAKEKEFLDSYSIIPFLRIADPAIKQRQQTTGHSIQIEYSQNGVNLATGQKRDVNAGLDKMINYLRLGKWVITEDCPNLIREMRKYKRGQYATAKLREKNNKKEEPQKKDDHGIDSCRYFFSYMPDLNPQQPAPTAIVKPNLLDAPTITIYPKNHPRHFGVFDDSVSQPLVRNIPYDEYVGEY